MKSDRNVQTTPSSMARTARTARTRRVGRAAPWALALCLPACGSAPPAESSAAAPESVGETQEAVDTIGVGDILGAISNAYGAFQAGQFVQGLILNTPSLTDVETEILSTLQTYRDQALVAEMRALVDDFNEVMADPQLMVSTNRLPQVLNDANAVEEGIASAINTGSAGDANQLGPALNLFVPVHAHILKYAGYGNDVVNAVFSRTLQVDFQMAGAWITSRYNPLNNVLPYERGRSLLWPADVGNGYFTCPVALLTSEGLCSGSTCPSLCTPGGSCFASTSTGGDPRGVQVAAAAASACTLTVSRTANQVYNRHSSVNVIEASMNQIIGLGLNKVTASDGTTITIVDPVGRAGGIALTGGAGWNSIPVAFSNGDGSFAVTNVGLAPFGLVAPFPLFASAGEIALSGDIGGGPLGIIDGRSDLLLAGPAASFLIATSNGDGSFGTISRPTSAQFGTWTTMAGVTPVAADFNGDGSTDVALVGGPGWGSVPVAFAGLPTPPFNGQAIIANVGLASFPAWAQIPGVRPLAGDFDGDGKADLALTGGPGWGSLPVAFSNGDGSFRVTNNAITDFATWATLTGTPAFVGDFDGDGKADVALTGGAGWNTLPVAFSNGNGTFRIANAWIGDFASWAAIGGVRPVVGDFDGDGRSDVALIGGAGWGSVPVAFSNGDGTFRVTNVITAGASNLQGWSTSAGVQALGGVFR